MPATESEEETITEVVARRDAQRIGAWSRSETDDGLARFDDDVIAQWQDDDDEIAVFVSKGEHSTGTKEGETYYEAGAKAVADGTGFESKSLARRDESLETALDKAIDYMERVDPDQEMPAFSARISGGILDPLTDFLDRFGHSKARITIRGDEIYVESVSFNRGVDFTIPGEDMESYQADSEGVFAVEVDAFRSAVQNFGRTDTIPLSLDPGDDRPQMGVGPTQIRARPGYDYIPRPFPEPFPEDFRFTADGLNFRDVSLFIDSDIFETAVVGVQDGVALLHGEDESTGDSATARFETSVVEGEGLVTVENDAIADVRRVDPRFSETDVTFTAKFSEPMLMELEVGDTPVDIRVVLAEEAVPRDMRIPEAEITVPDEQPEPVDAGGGDAVDEFARQAAEEGAIEAGDSIDAVGLTPPFYRVDEFAGDQFTAENGGLWERAEDGTCPQLEMAGGFPVGFNTDDTESIPGSLTPEGALFAAIFNRQEVGEYHVYQTDEQPDADLSDCPHDFNIIEEIRWYDPGTDPVTFDLWESVDVPQEAVSDVLEPYEGNPHDPDAALSRAVKDDLRELIETGEYPGEGDTTDDETPSGEVEIFATTRSRGFDPEGDVRISMEPEPTSQEAQQKIRGEVRDTFWSAGMGDPPELNILADELGSDQPIGTARVRGNSVTDIDLTPGLEALGIVTEKGQTTDNRRRRIRHEVEARTDNIAAGVAPALLESERRSFVNEYDGPSGRVTDLPGVGGARSGPFTDAGINRITHLVVGLKGDPPLKLVQKLVDGLPANVQADLQAVVDEAWREGIEPLVYAATTPGATFNLDQGILERALETLGPHARSDDLWDALEDVAAEVPLASTNAIISEDVIDFLAGDGPTAEQVVSSLNLEGFDGATIQTLLVTAHRVREGEIDLGDAEELLEGVVFVDETPSGSSYITQQVFLSPDDELAVEQEVIDRIGPASQFPDGTKVATFTVRPGDRPDAPPSDEEEMADREVVDITIEEGIEGRQPPPQETVEEEESKIMVNLVGGSLNYNVVPPAPAVVEDEAIAAARDTLGPPGQFDSGSEVGTISYRDTEVTGIGFDAGRTLLSEEDADADDTLTDEVMAVVNRINSLSQDAIPLEDSLNRAAEREAENELNIARRRAERLAESLEDMDAGDIDMSDINDAQERADRLETILEESRETLEDDDEADEGVDEEPEDEEPDVEEPAEEETEEPEPPTEPTQFSRGQIETIVERATLALDVAAQVIGSQLRELKLRPIRDGPVDYTTTADTVTVGATDGAADTMREAIERWEGLIDADSLDRDEVDGINERREALQDQFNVRIPRLSLEVPPPEEEPEEVGLPLSADEIESIVERSTDGVDVTALLNEQANSLRIRLAHPADSDVQFRSEPEEVQGVATDPIPAINEAIQEWDNSIRPETADLAAAQEQREQLEDEFGIDLVEIQFDTDIERTAPAEVEIPEGMADAEMPEGPDIDVNAQLTSERFHEAFPKLFQSQSSFFVDHFSTLEELITTPIGDLLDLSGVGEGTIERMTDDRPVDPNATIRQSRERPLGVEERQPAGPGSEGEQWIMQQIEQGERVSQNSFLRTGVVEIVFPERMADTIQDVVTEQDLAPAGPQVFLQSPSFSDTMPGIASDLKSVQFLLDDPDFLDLRSTGYDVDAIMQSLSEAPVVALVSPRVRTTVSFN